MKRYLTLLLLVGIHTISFSQAGLYAHINPVFQNIKSKTFATFLDEYKQVHQPLLSAEGVKPSLGNGWSVAAGYIEGNAILGIEYVRAKQNYTAFFANGGERKFSLCNNLFMFNFGLAGRLFGEGDGHSMFIIPELGAGLGNAKIVSTYKQGNTNVNSDLLDGVYKGFHAKVNGGMRLAYTIQGIGINVGAKYHLPMFPLELTDKNKNFIEDDRLATNFKAWSSNPGQVLPEGVKDDFKYWQFSIGLVLIVSD